MNKENNSNKSESLIIGIHHHNSGELSIAENFYIAAIKENELDYEAWHLLGVIAAQKNNPNEGVRLISKSLDLEPKNVEANNNLGLIQASIHKLEAAIDSFNRAINISPEYVDAWYNKGNAQQALYKFEDAISSYDHAIAINPAIAEIYNNKGNAQQALYKFEDAISSYDRAIAINANYADAWYNKGLVFQALKKYPEALNCFDKSLNIEPKNADCLNNKGDVFNELGLNQEAYKQYELAIAVNPDHLPARFGATLSLIPKVFSDHQNLTTIRNEFSERLKKLQSWIKLNNPINGFEAVGIHQPFYLAYQDKDNKLLLEQYGELCRYLMQPLQDLVDKRQIPKPSNLEKINVGIVSNHFTNHSVWNAITKGFVTNLDNRKFEIHCFAIDAKSDAETRIAQTYSNSFTQCLPTVEEWIKAITDKKIEVLIFPEIGMDKVSFQLANLRLAPLQIAAWGHPETTGLKTIDFYLSAQLFENKNSHLNYTEKLLALPNLGCFIEPSKDSIDSIDLKGLGLDENHPILVSPGTPFKYSPEFDEVVIEIAQKLPLAQIVFFDFPSSSTEILINRLKNKFDNENLFFSKSIKFIPLLNLSAFKGLMKKADLFIDSIGFSGFNTATLAAECNLPIVTREGQFMRGNLAAGILKRMGIPELIAFDNKSYVELVINLILNPDRINQISKKISASKHNLFLDTSPINALEKFLLSECRSLSN